MNELILLKKSMLPMFHNIEVFTVTVYSTQQSQHVNMRERLTSDPESLKSDEYLIKKSKHDILEHIFSMEIYFKVEAFVFEILKYVKCERWTL